MVLSFCPFLSHGPVEYCVIEILSYNGSKTLHGTLFLWDINKQEIVRASSVDVPIQITCLKPWQKGFYVLTMGLGFAC